MGPELEDEYTCGGGVVVVPMGKIHVDKGAGKAGWIWVDVRGPGLGVYVHVCACACLWWS